MTFLESTATLRATGGFRYVSAAFFTVWLVGWAIGEAVALSVIAVLIASTIPALAGLPISTATAKWLADDQLALHVPAALVLHHVAIERDRASAIGAELEDD